MKQKHKNKGSPFAAVLRPGEEILWFYQFRPLRERIWPFALAIYVACFGFALLMASAVKTYPQASLLSDYQVEVFVTIFLGSCGPVTVFMLPVWILQIFRRRADYDVTNHMITNQRIFLCRGGSTSRGRELSTVRDILLRKSKTDGSVSVRFRVPARGFIFPDGDDNDYLWWGCPPDEGGDELWDAIHKLDVPILIEGQGHKPEPVSSEDAL